MGIWCANLVLVIVYFQIANLKAALARKEEEPDSAYLSTLSSPERQRMNSARSSPSHPHWQSAGDVSANRGQPTENVGHLEVSTAHYRFSIMWVFLLSFSCIVYFFLLLVAKSGNSSGNHGGLQGSQGWTG